ncbi:MAG: hypothetical protein SGBAC_012364 [Bacillariaceae sp.]
MSNHIVLANLFSTIPTPADRNDDNETRERLESPILNTKLEENMRLLFDGLVNHIQDSPRQFRDKGTSRSSIRENDDMDAVELYEKFNDHIHRLVSQYPVLARVVMIQGVFSRKSLLSVACQNLQQQHSYPAIQFLIEKNPSALLWKQNNAVRASSPICTIARTQSLCGLMPWIAESYTWILDHPICIQSPPALLMMDLCTLGNCQESVAKEFFTTYPQGLVQDDASSKDGLPLHRLLNGRGLFDMELFRWMADQNPDSLSYQDKQSKNILHHACENASEGRFSCAEVLYVCQYLIQMHPQLSRNLDREGNLPIHALVNECENRIILDMALLLLSTYPESYDIPTQRLPPVAPKDIKLLQSLHPLVSEQMELTNIIALLKTGSDGIKVAVQVNCTHEETSLLPAVASVFRCWARLQNQILDVKLQAITSEIETIKSESCLR